MGVGRKRKQRARARGRSRGQQTLTALTGGAMSLPGLAGPAAADTPQERYRADYTWSTYKEDDIAASKVATGSTSRYEIESHQVSFSAPILDRFDLGVDFVYETMSGATPWYIIPDAGNNPLQVMTGATVEETRVDVLANGSYYLDTGRVGLSAGVSHENDYFAINGGVNGDKHFNEKNTTLSGGLGFSVDQITPTGGGTLGRVVEEDKQSLSAFVGLSQLLGLGTAIQSTLNYQYSQGFLSDPYKRVQVGPDIRPDSRPDMRHQLSWLTRFRHHVDWTGSTLHLDYRFYGDDWGILSHTFDLGLYQTIWRGFRVVPSFRYYSQSQAEFYAPFFPNAAPANFDASSDYRLSPYGALSYRIRGEAAFRTWELDWRLALTYERYVSSGDYALGEVQVENPGLVSFNRLALSVTGMF